ncbi:MAG: hypothetical protein ACW981_12050 [Candidatus Hodarchaeales archaeon]|jgi:hypothetical protein
MSSGLEEIILERKKAFFIQNLIENHKIGIRLSEKALGFIPKFLVLNKINKSFFDGRNGVLLLGLEYNSELGGFQAMIAFKEFSNDEDAQYNVLLHNWVEKRIKNNPRVRIPEIYATGKNYIIYEGVKSGGLALTADQAIKKVKIAGEILATYHSAELHPINVKRYSMLLDKTINNLPLSMDRRKRLLELGYTLLANYDHSKGGVFAYGDFHPDNVIIAPGETHGYLIDPEFIETEKNADRYEDIANYFVFNAINEYKEQKTINNTIQLINAFVRSYNGYLEQQGLNLEQIYGKKVQTVELFFHLGLIAIIKGVFTSKEMVTVTREITESELGELLSIYQFVKELWMKALELVPETAFPEKFSKIRIDEDKRVVSHIALGVRLLEYLQTDSHFQIVFKKTKKDKPLRYYEGRGGMENKKDVENNIKDLNTWFDNKIIDLKKDTIIIKDEFINNMDLEHFIDNWEENKRKLFHIFNMKPKYRILKELIKKELIDDKELEKETGINQKEIKKVLEELMKNETLFKISHTISINPNWREIIDKNLKTILLAQIE